MPNPYSREDFHPARPRMHPADKIVIGICVTGLVLMWAAWALAAEPDRQKPHEITLFWKDPDAAGRGHQVLSGPYASREECRNAILRVRVMVSGARLACHPVELGRVQ